MNRGDLLARIARDTGLTRRDVDRVLGAFIAHVMRALRRGDDVTLVDFGTFDVVRHRARGVRHPKTGARIEIPARRVARFSAGKALRRQLKGVAGTKAR